MAKKRKCYRIKTKHKQERVSCLFIDKTNKSASRRVVFNRDKKPLSLPRMTQAMAEDPLFDELLKRLERKPNKEDLF